MVTMVDPTRRRTPEPELVAAAAQNPGGRVAEIDHDVVRDPDGYVPAEAVVGVWEVDAQGRLTGEFHANPRYGPVHDDFAKLTGGGHWLGWLGDDPAATIRDSVAGILGGQVAGATVPWMKIVDEPRYRTAGRPVPEDPDRVLVTRAGLAASFALGVDSPSGGEILWGVYTVVVVGLDAAAHSRVWLDLWTDLDAAEERLASRLYEVEPAD
jgi:hypothetical protein